MRNAIEKKINETKSWIFENIKLKTFNFINKEQIQINKIRNERGDITIDNTEIKKSIRDYYEQLYTKKLDNLEEMDIFLETHNLSKLN